LTGTRSPGWCSSAAPRGWPCASPADERTRKLARRLFFLIESKDEPDSAFSLDTFSDKTFIITTSGSFVLLVLSTVLSIFQTVLKTIRLDVVQWLICTAVALFGRRRRRDPQSGPAAADGRDG
jgi:hypothetical protein